MTAILEKRRFRDFDWLLTLLATGIVLFGAWQIHNAQPTGELQNFWPAIPLGIWAVVVIASALRRDDKS